MMNKSITPSFVICLFCILESGFANVPEQLSKDYIACKNHLIKFEQGLNSKNPNQAIQYFDSLVLYSKTKDTAFITNIQIKQLIDLATMTNNNCLLKELLYKSACYWFNQYDYNKTIIYAMKSDSISCDSAYLDYEANSLMYLLHFNLEDYGKSIEFCRKNLHIARYQLKDSSLVCAQLNELGFTYIKLGLLKQAKTYLFEAIRIGKKVHSARGYYMAALDNMAQTYAELGELDSALHFFKECLAWRIKESNDWGIGNTLTNIGKIHLQKLNFSKADSCLTTAIVYAEKSKAIETSHTQHLLRDNYYAQYQLNLSKKQYKKALQYYVGHIALRDTINNQLTRRRILRLEAKYENIKKERQIREQQAFIEKKKAQFRFLAIISAVIILLGFVIGILIYKTRKQKEKLIRHEAEKLRQELELKNKELVCNVRSIYVKNQVINKVARRLSQSVKEISSNGSEIMKSMIGELRRNLDDTGWKEFELRFSRVHESFYQDLNTKFPHLSENEKKLAALLKLGLSSKEIASITMTQSESVDTARSRLRKKLGISTDQNLTEFLNKV